MCALEAAFTRGKGAPVVQNVAEGTAFLIRRAASDRRVVEKDVGRLYDKRSKLVHGEQTAVTVADLKEIQFIVFQALCLLLLNVDTFKKITIEDWVQSQKYGEKYEIVWPKPK